MPIYSKMKQPALPPIIIDNAAPITISAQLTQQIKLLITLGKLQPNQALPTLVRLAEHLGVNHTTIALVYNELIASGHLVAQRGKGTFIADSPQVKQMAARKHFYDLLESAFHSASKFGLSPAEFSAAAYAQAILAKQHKLLNLVFANSFPDTIDAAKSLEAEIGMPVVPIPWDKLQSKDPQALAQISKADLIVTTIKYLWNVANLAGSNQEVIGVEVKPNLQLLSCISALPRHTKLLFVCKQQISSEAMKQIIEYNIHHLESEAVTLDWVDNNKQQLHQFNLVICSQQVEKQVRKSLPPMLKFMIFSVGIDPVNLLVLKTRLSAIEMEKSMA